MARVANRAIKVKKLLEVIGDVARGEKGVESEVFSFSLNKFDPAIIANDMNIAVGVGRQTARERREVGEGSGERTFEKGNEVGNRVRRVGEKNTLLNIVAREHGEIRNRELKGVE